MSKLRFPRSVLHARMEKFQGMLRSREIDAVMIRVKSTFTYFTGTKWLRPALLIPANDEPVLFSVKGEEDELGSRTWIGNIITFREGGELMSKVSGAIRKNNYKVVGLEFGIERDAYILFYEIFKRLNPSVRVVDVSDLIFSMRMIKDKYELNAIREAGKIGREVLKRIQDVIFPGISETEIASEMYHQAYKLGSEEPKIHVNAGPNPRVHMEPFRDIKVREGTVVALILGIDYNNYYVNLSRTYVIGKSGVGRKALECAGEVYVKAKELTKAGIRAIDVMKELDNIYRKYNLIENRVVGYLHGVGLQVEEPPITTIIPKHRFMEIKENMAVALVHAPIMIKGLGQVKLEDTFIVGKERLESITP